VVGSNHCRNFRLEKPTVPTLSVTICIMEWKLEAPWVTQQL